MNAVRLLAGLACVAAGLFLTVVLLVTGEGDGSRSPALMAHLPPVAFGLALMAVGCWLLLKRKRPR